jgi:hypothetical protein
MIKTKKGYIGNYPNHHKELIKCPECGLVQNARVEHTIPWYTYIHHCTQCEYVIMESEWDEILH